MMVFMSLYTIVDGVFISRYVSSDALSATNIVYPMISILFAIGIMLATGGGAFVAKELGEKKVKKAHSHFTFITVVALAISLVFMGIVLLFLDDICRDRKSVV